MTKTTFAGRDVANRRLRLREWIDLHFEGSQTQFIADCEEHGFEINQGELSGLLRKKSFGEKKARSLEVMARMTNKWLDMPPDTSPPKVKVNSESIPMVREVGISDKDLWPFANVKPWQWSLLSKKQQNHVEKGVVYMLEARASPEKQHTPAHSRAAAKAT